MSAEVLILVVEDDPDVRESVVEVLEDAGREVVTAENGAVALSKLAALPRPCLVVLDLMMPEMGGLQFLEQLNASADAQGVAVLVVSASASLEKAEHHPGVLGTLRKPFDADELLAWVGRYRPSCTTSA
jgi:CheY-like chemotaxis protein